MKPMAKTMLRVAAGLLATTGMSTVAQAQSYAWTFTDNSSNVLASGGLTTQTTLNTAGGYNVTSISGTVAGFGAITGLVPNPNAPNVANFDPDPSANTGTYNYDNVLFVPGPPYINFNGILFQTASETWNIFRSPTIAGDVLSGYVNGAFYPDGSNENFAGTFAITAVPEPASWALMIMGFGAVGGSLRYRRRATTVAFAA